MAKTAKPLSPEERRKLNERLANAARQTDGELLSTVTRAYGAAARDIAGEIDRLEAKMAAAADAGETVNAGWLARAGRARALQSQVKTALAAFASQTAPDIVGTKKDLLLAGSEHAAEMLKSFLGPPPRPVDISFNTLNATAAETLAARSKYGDAPIRDVLARYNDETAASITDKLFSGVARGRNPTAIARDLRDELGSGAYNALRFARTEVITAYRDGRLDTWRDNRDYMDQWEWAAADDERTCPFCAEMDGTIHDLDEDFDTHPNCRCSPKPITKSWDDIFAAIGDGSGD